MVTASQLVKFQRSVYFTSRISKAKEKEEAWVSQSCCFVHVRKVLDFSSELSPDSVIPLMFVCHFPGADRVWQGALPPVCWWGSSHAA